MSATNFSGEIEHSKLYKNVGKTDVNVFLFLNTFKKKFKINNLGFSTSS